MSAAAAIITPDRAREFFGECRAVLAQAKTEEARETAWFELVAVTAAKVQAHEIGRAVAADQLTEMAGERDAPNALFPDFDVDTIQKTIGDAFAAALTNGHAQPDETTEWEPDYGAALLAAASIDERPAPPPPLVFVTPAQWPEEAPPPVDWLAAGRIPRGDVTTLHGDGGAGKTDIALRLAANVARGAPDWLGHDIANGPVVFVSGEEPEREVRRRIWNHGLHDGYGQGDLTSLHQWFPDSSGDAVFATPDRNTGIMRPTRLMQALVAAIERESPVLIVVDNVAATFAGNQNDRVMVRSYVNLWRAVAHGASKPAVLLLDHPSLSGLTNGSGRGGNMDWRNAVRSALWLHAADDKAEADRGIRVLKTAKSNYGPPGNPIRLQWADGGLQMERAPSSLHRLAKDAECERALPAALGRAQRPRRGL